MHGFMPGSETGQLVYLADSLQHQVPRFNGTWGDKARVIARLTPLIRACRPTGFLPETSFEKRTAL